MKRLGIVIGEKRQQLLGSFHHPNNNNIPSTTSTLNSLNLLSLRGAHDISSDKNESEDRKEEADGDDTVRTDSNEVRKALNKKNLEELEQDGEAVATVLPEEVLGAAEPDTFWAPDPETGVFVPAEEGEVDVRAGLPAPPRPSGITDGNIGSSNGDGNGDGSSVLEQTVWVREVEIEEVERPPPIEIKTED